MAFSMFSGFFCGGNLTQRLVPSMCRPVYCLLILITLCIGFQVPAVFAHNVVSGVYADGMLIEGEIGFSNGDMAQAGSPVNVFNEAGDLLAELTLAEGGVFSYTAKTQAKHLFKADLSAGHIAEMVIEADELVPPAAVVSQVASLAKQTSTTSAQPTAATIQSAQSPATSSNENALSENSSDSNKGKVSITPEQLKSMVRSAVAQQIRPLQKDLRAYKEKVMFRDIAGGLGFIFGLFGVAAWMASRRKQGDKHAAVP